MGVSVDGKSFGCLAEAIENARPGDTMYISGTHTDEQFIIPQRLEGLAVVGTDKATITVSSGHAMQCCAVGVTITGLALIVSKESEEGESAVEVTSEGNMKLKSCQVRNCGGDGVQVFGQCKIESCEVSECKTYGVAVLKGGVASIENSTIAKNKKTGVLSRGKDSRVSLSAGVVIQNNDMHGVGADDGGSFTAVSILVRDNGYVGVNLGDSGSGELAECEIVGNRMHGLQSTGGTMSAAKCAVRKSGKLGVFVNPPPLSAAVPLGKPQQEEARAKVSIREVEVTDSGIYGIHVTGGYLDAIKCDVTRSRDSGVVAKGGYVYMSGCTVSDNARFGVSYSEKKDQEGRVVSTSAGEVKDCSVSGNTGVGVYCSGAECALVGTKVLQTKMSNPPVQAEGSGVSAVLGGLISLSGCKIAQNASFGIFVHGGSESLKRASGVSVERSAVAHNGSYGASVAPASPDTKGFRANLRICARSDFSNNPQGPVEGFFYKDTALAVYVGAGLGVLALAYLASRWKRQ